jgi:UDP-2,3-diacylglucosamine hydrolase
VKKTLIFSDVHLKVTPEDRPRHAEFIDFLRGFPPGDFDRVVCLGDLFDFWFEYRHVIYSGYFEVLRAFADLRDAGVELHLICGNHDFWAGRFLQETLGFRIHPNTVDLPFGTQTAHFVHGDGINPGDHGYHVYKRIARNPWVIRAFRLLHPDWAMALAQGVSHGSRTLLAPPDPYHGAETRSLRAYARDRLASGAADVVLCGHAHAPLLEHHPTPGGTGIYINTGDWIGRRSHVVWDPQAGFHLHVGNPHPSQPPVPG